MSLPKSVVDFAGIVAGIAVCNTGLELIFRKLIIYRINTLKFKSSKYKVARKPPQKRGLQNISNIKTFYL